MSKEKSKELLSSKISPDYMAEVSKIKNIPTKKRNDISEFEEYEPQWINLAEKSPESQEWFIQDLIPANTSTLFAGSGGIGKSLVLLFLGAHTTTGLPFNLCGKTVILPKGSVILMSAEGKIEINVIPTLIALGADRTKIHAITSNIGSISKKRRLLQLDVELNTIEEKVKTLFETENPVKLIIIDPIMYFLGDIKDYIPQEVANFIHQLNDLAEKYSITILFNKHRRKQSGAQTFAALVDEVGGTAAWTNSPRQALGFIKHPKTPNTFLMGSIKSNAAKETNLSYPYTIEGISIIHEGKKIKTIKLVWNDKPEKMNINEASSKDNYEKSKQQICSEIIFNHLKENGISTRRKIIEICDAEGINERMRQRVINKMKSEKEINEIKTGLTPQYELSDDFGK